MKKCDACQQQEVKINIASKHDTEALCVDCHNNRRVQETGVILENHPKALVVEDCEGGDRHFRIEQLFMHTGISLKAKEMNTYGYTFEVYGEPDCDQAGLFQQLIDKMKRGLSQKYLEEETFLTETRPAMVNNHFVGNIEYNRESGKTPLIVIDGKPYTWEAIGKMIMAYEGFQMQLKIIDLIDEAE